MEPLSLKKVQHYTGGDLSKTVDFNINSITTSSNEIGENALFIPIKGERFDGHDFIQDAIDNGAIAILSHDRSLQFDTPTVYVDDTRRALLDISAGYRGRFDIPVIGVTGSVGKTTTKEMIWSVVSQKYHTLKTEGNFNNQIGMPKTLFRIDNTTEAAVIEMGMSNFGEISSMTVAARPTLAVITNIGVSHIEFLGSREGICQAKLEMLEGLAKNGTVVLNGDEPLLWDKKQSMPDKTVYFGIENPNCDVIAKDIELYDDRATFNICFKDRVLAATIYVTGKHNVMNALAAATIGDALALSDEQILEGLAAFRTTGMRQNIYHKNGYTIIEDCYNASPDSIEAALEVLKNLKTDGERIAVLGGIRELGGYFTEGHIRCGKKAASCCDKMYLYGEGAQEYLEGAISNGMCESNIFIFHTHKELADKLRENSGSGDVLLFKGSRGMQMEKALALFLGEEV